ncbi:MAG: YfhO family protein [Oscillospiraceae bacterium]|nr:YfhO family protein [Oscillospiraceae bacterium]
MSIMAKAKAKANPDPEPTVRKTAVRIEKPRPVWLQKLDEIYFWEVLAFVIPFLLMGYAFKKAEMHPFGDKSFFVTDLWHQYYPFFELLQEKLKTGGSILYSWRTGIGTNFLALIAYYAASPLNWLSIFMNAENLRDGMLLILLLKFSFAGFFMAKCLRYVFHKNDLSITMFSIMYALCSYMLGYYWNTIWIDTVAMLPLVMLGLTMLVREGKYRVYVISLALALFSNYYIAYFICIFTVIAFFCLCLFENLKIKKFFKRFALITGGSLLGAGLSAFILLPTFQALQLTHSANNSFPKSVSFYESWKDLVANMLAHTEPTSKEGLPNLYCGLLPVLLIGAFLVAKKIRIREKISAVLILVFLVVSCNMNYLNFIWHGFHFTNMIPYRFSFLFSFVMLIMAYRAYQVLLEEKLSVFQWIGMLAVGGVFCWIAYQSGIQEDDNHAFVKFCMILGGVYLAIILCRLFTPKAVIQVLLAGVIGFEMSDYAVRGVKSVGSSGYSSYPASNSEVQDLLALEDDSDVFHRTELSMWYSLNDPSLYKYNGISQFSSMANESTTTFCRRIGLPASESGNRYYYANTSPLTNLLMDVRYMIAKDGYNADSVTMNQISQSGTSTLYETVYNLGLGFMMPELLKEYEIEDMDNPFEQQNLLFQKLTGIETPLFKQIDITHVGHQGFDVSRLDYGKYSYTKQEDASDTVFLKYNYTTTKTGMAYAYAKVPKGDYLEVYRDNAEQLHKYNIGRQPYITPVGYFQAGELVNLRCTMKDEAKSGTVYIYFYELNEEVLKQGYELLENGRFTITDMDDTHVSGQVTASQDGVLYLSIPYESGWSAQVDGQKAELISLMDAMCGIELSAGAHEIKLKYSPAGFVPGVVITFGSLGILILLWIYEKKHPEKFQEESEPESDSDLISESVSDPDTDPDTDSEQESQELEENERYGVDDIFAKYLNKDKNVQSTPLDMEEDLLTEEELAAYLQGETDFSENPLNPENSEISENQENM